MKLLRGAKKSTRDRNKLKRDHKVEIDLEWLKDQYHRQRGRCYYSGIALKFGVKKEWALSLERINEEHGYTPTNCVLCCLEFNTGHNCQWSKDKIAFLLTDAAQRQTN